MMARGGALAIRLEPERKMINLEQHHVFINMKLFMKLVSILDFSIPFMFFTECHLHSYLYH